MLTLSVNFIQRTSKLVSKFFQKVLKNGLIAKKKGYPFLGGGGQNPK